MTTAQSAVAARYREEASETSSIPDEELNRILTSEIQHEFKDMPEGVSIDPMNVVRLQSLSQVSAEAIERLHRNPEYRTYMEVFEKQYGRSVYDSVEINRVTKKLDSNFKVLQEHTKGIDGMFDLE
eukprot:TRINITY_DN6594_c0_g1_i6.p2 TRINITY_DN6594_c0_g1~~TRINITY_DN6594_c0_g1_i6.p2  ORF type:complete len:126 (-),score=31.75 TRINITY_DN6594_c0_g1_i6:372-749(-)